MPFASRYRADPVTSLPELAGLSIRRELSAAAMAALQNRSIGEMSSRFAAGHRAYVAMMEGQPAAWGWVATSTANIGELGASLTLNGDERYLWNFVTLPAYRGLGIYPRLLQGIVAAESAEANRFWIGYAPENHASGVGILLVEQNVRRALEASTRSYLLSEGRIVLGGTSAELLASDAVQRSVLGI